MKKRNGQKYRAKRLSASYRKERNRKRGKLFCKACAVVAAIAATGVMAATLLIGSHLIRNFNYLLFLAMVIDLTCMFVYVIVYSLLCTWLGIERYMYPSPPKKR